MKTILSLLFCLAPYLSSYSQPLENVRIEVSAGGTWQSTIMNFFNFRQVPRFSPYMPYVYECNIQGVGFQPTLRIGLKESRFRVLYSPTLRHDYVQHIRAEPPSVERHNVYKWFLNHHFVLHWEVNRKPNKFGRHQTLGLGYSLFNPKKYRVEFYDPRFGGQQFAIPLRFPTFTARYEWPIKKHLELAAHAHYLYGYYPDTPFSPQLHYMLYSLSFSYNWQLDKSRK
jgi:hypothetical protein